MNLAKKLLMTTGEAAGGNIPSGGYVDDVFSTYTYTGTGISRSLATGQDLAGFGGMAHVKNRLTTDYHYVYHSSRGVNNYLVTNDTTEQRNINGATLTGFNSDGFSLGSGGYSAVNGAVGSYIAWVFRNAPRFYGHQFLILYWNLYTLMNY
jgi:hypothetical protein